jgi:4-amino-4-deoxy-L-arabinose transferase-like glycosyltransferase
MSAPISASGSPGAVRLSPTTALWVLVGATLAARLIAGALAPLSEDEAYYRLWSLKPAFGYFDHPPMVAWWTWLGRQIAGDTPLGVRLMFALGAGATTLLTFDLARVAGLSERVALRAAIWFNATLLIGLGGELAVPDGPNTLFWVAALACAFRAVRGHGAWWLGAGAAAGLACLAKYSALFLAPGVVLWLLLTREGRRALLTPWPWLAAVIAVAVFAPNVAWNAQHGWVTFQKQFGRVAAGGLAPGYLAKLLIDQTVLLNPLIVVFLGIAALRRIAWPLLVIGAPFALYLVVHSLHDAVQGQWPSPLYPLLIIAAAAAAEGATGAQAWLRTAVPWVGFTLCAAALAFSIAPYDGGLPVRDPSASWRDWPGFLARVEQARSANGAAWVGAPDYGLAAQLASAPQIHAPATEIFERARFTFEVPAERADFTRPGLIVSPPKSAQLPAISRCFASVRLLPSLVRGQGQGATVYGVFLVAQPRRDIERVGCYRADLPNFASSQAGTSSTSP